MFTAVICVGLFVGGIALAQSVVPVIQPEERTVIYDYVVKVRVKSVKLPEEVAAGMVVPPDVELTPVPRDIYGRVPSVRRYEYFDWAGRVVFVDAESRKVVIILD